MRGHTAAVESAAFSPNGQRIVTASNDDSACIWDAATGTQIAALKGHTESVRSAVFSPDGQRIVTASEDGTARLWDAVTGEQIAVSKGHTENLRSAAFSPDGQRIVTASDDDSARIWDVSLTEILVGIRSVVLTAALSHGIGWRTDSERIDVLMRDAPDNLYAEALKQLGRTDDDSEIAEVAARLRAPLHPNCYLSPVQFAEKFAPARE